MNDAAKTTYQDLTSSSAAGVNALIEGSSTISQSHKADLQRRLDDAIRLSTPAIGQYWKGQGGIYAGIIRDGERQWHLLLASQLVETTTKDSAEKTFINALAPVTGQWGEYGVTIEGEFSRHDGQHNTQLIQSTDPHNQLANAITALDIDGHTDFYWPAQCELNLFFINLPEHFSPIPHWSSTQSSRLCAAAQHFEDGLQSFRPKDDCYAARAARRIPIE